MLNENFVILGALLSFLGGLSYLKDTLSGRVKPNKVTWLLWTIIPMIAFFAQIKQGVGIQALMTFMIGFVPLMIFIASFFNKKAEWKITKLDIACGILSLFGVILWAITRTGDIAILFSIIADFLAGLPTFIKSFKAPETESYLVYLMGIISAGLTLLTIDQWNLTYVGFPLYIFAANCLLVLLIKFKLGKIT